MSSLPLLAKNWRVLYGLRLYLLVVVNTLDPLVVILGTAPNTPIFVVGVFSRSAIGIVLEGVVDAPER